MSATRAGDSIQLDFRTKPANKQTKPLRFVQWNIERGLKIEQILKTLKELDADVIALQVSTPQRLLCN